MQEDGREECGETRHGGRHGTETAVPHDGEDGGTTVGGENQADDARLEDRGAFLYPSGTDGGSADGQADEPKALPVQHRIPDTHRDDLSCGTRRHASRLWIALAQYAAIVRPRGLDCLRSMDGMGHCRPSVQSDRTCRFTGGLHAHEV